MEIAAAAKALRLASRRFAHAVVRAKQKERDVHAQRAEELFSTPMEYACHPNHKFYWRHIKKARGTRTQMPTSLLSADGTRTVTEPADLKERWFSYYKEMACPPSPEVGDHVEEVEAFVEEVAEANARDPVIDAPITEAEVAEAQARRLHNFGGRAPVRFPHYRDYTPVQPRPSS